MKRALVTGASGLIGQQAMDALAARGFHVTGLSRTPPSATHYDWLTVDLRDPAATRDAVLAARPTHILHCAWDVTHGRFWTAPENLDHVAATLNLARAAGPSIRLAALGSSAEYDWSGPANPRREDAPCRPATLYGQAKHATHTLLAAHAAQIGQSFTWARIFHLYGAGEHPERLLPALAAAMRSGNRFTIRQGSMICDYMAVADAAAALAALLDSTLQGPLNIGAGSPMPLSEWGRLIAEQLGTTDQLTCLDAPPDASHAAMIPDLTRLRRELGLPPPAITGHPPGRMARG